MKLHALVYDWNGARRAAVSGPDVRIDTDQRWVMVSRAGRGTELVAWEWVRGGWCQAVGVLEQRLNEPTLAGEKLCFSASITSTTPTKSHRALSHQPDSAHLSVCGEQHADDDRAEGAERMSKTSTDRGGAS